MPQRGNPGPWMAGSFGAALLLAAIILAGFGSDDHGTRTALRVTARLSYLLFWPAYAGGSLARLFGPRLFPLSQRARCFGLSFASAHLVHIGLVAWLYRISVRPPVSDSTFLFFSTALVWTYLLALLSIARLADVFGRGLSRMLRIIGMEYIAFAFLVDFVGPLLGGAVKHPVNYLPFASLAVAGPMLRLAALARGLKLQRRAAPL
jgi:hypothetical protein